MSIIAYSKVKNENLYEGVADIFNRFWHVKKFDKNAFNNLSIINKMTLSMLKFAHDALAVWLGNGRLSIAGIRIL